MRYSASFSISILVLVLSSIAINERMQPGILMGQPRLSQWIDVISPIVLIAFSACCLVGIFLGTKSRDLAVGLHWFQATAIAWMACALAIAIVAPAAFESQLFR